MLLSSLISTTIRSRLPEKQLSFYKRTLASRAIENNDSDGVLTLILGKPGGGKGTISKKILKDFPDFNYLSTGDVLRSHVREQTKIGVEAKSYMDSGSLVPDELIIRLVMEDASNAIKEGNSILLDGFPRTITQAKALDEAINVDLVINLDIPSKTIIERISDRWIHPPSGRIYSYSYKPPRVHGKDDLTGEDLVQRDDDKPECVSERLKCYSETTKPLVEFYDNTTTLKTFKGTKSDVIYVDVKRWLEDNLICEYLAVASK